MRVRPGRMVSALLITASLLALSCARDSRTAVHPVRGTVTFQKKPATKAIVVLRPVAPGSPNDPLPHGEVGTDGTFRIGTFGAGDGAPAGEYVVTITWPEARTDPSGDEVTTDRLKGRFADPARSPWKVTIKEGENELGPFRLD